MIACMVVERCVLLAQPAALDIVAVRVGDKGTVKRRHVEHHCQRDTDQRGEEASQCCGLLGRRISLI
jgi:hypothetical protein